MVLPLSKSTTSRQELGTQLLLDIMLEYSKDGMYFDVAYYTRTDDLTEIGIASLQWSTV